MKDIRTLHRNAMEFMRQANSSLESRDNDGYIFNLQKAFDLEEEASLGLLSKFDSEPTRSVLFRSAANLAYNLGKFDKAEKLVYQALSGSPHIEIKRELLQLIDLIELASVKELSKNDLFEYSYVNTIRENAVNLKVEPKTDRYSKAVVVDYIIDFLKNMQTSFKNLSEIQFRKNFNPSDIHNYEDVLSLFKKESNILAVDLKFESFGVGLVADTKIMNNRDFVSDKFSAFKKGIFEDFKKDVIFADFNSEEFQKIINDKYDDAERVKIYSPIILSLDSKAEYKVSISDENFKFKVKDVPTISKKSQSFLKPKIEKAIEQEGDLLIKKTLELTDSEGTKRTKLQTEFLTYAEFVLEISNIKDKNQNIDIFFSDPYSLKVIFSYNTFLIEDNYFGIYVENRDFKEIQKSYEHSLAKKYVELITKSELSIDEKLILENMQNTFITT